MVVTNVKQETSCRKIVAQCGCFSLLEYEKDISVNSATATAAYFASKMNVHKRQVIADLNGNGVIVQAGAMQWIAGSVNMDTGVKGIGDFAKKLVGSKVTGESAVKPHYTGTGVVVLEPTYKHILFEDIASWGGGMVIDDGLFYACDDTVTAKVVSVGSLSAAALGGEGLFHNCLSGRGIAVLESPVPRDELIVMDLTDPNDVVKIDGNMAIAWSSTLKFTTELATKSILGSAASGEGVVNVYRGTGRILMAPVASK